MEAALASSVIQPSLEWSIHEFGGDFFRVRWYWTQSEKVFRWETRSTLERLKGYENIYGDLTNYGLAAAMRNMAKIIRGKDKESVKVHAFRLVAKMTPTKRRMNLPVLTVWAMPVAEQAVPSVPQHQEIEIPSYCIDVVNFDQAVCAKEMVKELERLGLPMPVAIDYDPMFPLLSR